MRKGPAVKPGPLRAAPPRCGCGQITVCGCLVA